MADQIIDTLWCGTRPSQQALYRAGAIKLLLMDVDGVITDGRVYYVPLTDGSAYETKGFDSHDGLAFNFLQDAGIDCGFISGRRSEAVEERAVNMHVQHVYQGSLQKEENYEKVLAEANLIDEQVAYIGDDFTDLPILKRVGLACAVANARAEVKPYAHFVTAARGGQGAVREVVELILKAQKKWQSILEKYGAAS